ncbi:MAG: hypothetical protein LBL08_00640 [Candidatus Nomurabacteria bacterium]|nr:hypothetical protein [Candidatus Nomurabacteria bacterium]
MKRLERDPSAKKLAQMSDEEISEHLAQLATEQDFFKLLGQGDAPTARQIDGCAPNVFETLSNHFNLKTTDGAPSFEESIKDSSFLLSHLVEPKDLDLIEFRLRDIYERAFSRDFGLDGCPIIDLPNISTEHLEWLLGDLIRGDLRHSDALEDSQAAHDVLENAAAYLVLYNDEGSTDQFKQGKFGPAQVKSARQAERFYTALNDYSDLRLRAADLRQCLIYEIMQSSKRDLLSKNQRVRTANYEDNGEVYSYKTYDLPGVSASGLYSTTGFYSCPECGFSKDVPIKLVVGPIPIRCDII